MNRRFPAGVVWISAASLFADIAGEAVNSILPLYLVLQLGASPAALGLIEGIAETTASLLKLFAGWWSDRLTRVKPLVMIGYFWAATCKGLMVFATSWPHMLFLRFGDRVGKGIRGAPRDAWLSKLAPQRELPRIFGFNRAMDHLGAVLGPIFASAFLYFSPGNYRHLFLWTMVPGFLAGFCLVPPKESQARAQKSLSPDLGRLPPRLYSFVGVIALFTLANATDAFLILRLKETGLPVTLIPLTWAALHLVKMGVSLVSHRFLEYWGSKRLLCGAWLFYAGIYFAFGYIQDARVLALLVVAYGIFFGLTEGPERALIAELTPNSLRGRGYGYFALAHALPALPASLLFGFLWQTGGSFLAFSVAAAIASTAALLLSITRLD